MNSKLTLRLDDALIRKAKQLAKKRGTSVSGVFGDFVARQTDPLPEDDFPPITASMIGAIKREDAPIGAP